SYTYFTWRNSAGELRAYLTELTTTEVREYMRPNFFANTPDILHEYLQTGGRPAFEVRLILAATLSASYGIYSGFELCENVPVRPGSEEYLDSEKYQLRPRDWEGAEAEGRSLAPYLTRLNEIRREHPALQRLRNITFHHPDDQAFIVYSKREPSRVPGEHDDPGDPGDIVIVVINLDPHAARESIVHLDMPALGMDWHDHFAVHDEISGHTWRWGEHNYVRLDPADEPAHVLTVRRTQ
ncbi:MAG: alpha-1,4-glucan--maltose-1-phosphate maltosyltransferase, partial [Nocardioidaceae bacterium]